MNENLNEGLLGSIGKAALGAAKPMIKKGGKKVFRKAARAGIKKFGKNATRHIINGAKQIAKDPDVQQAALEAGKNGLETIKNKFIKKPKQQPTEEQLIENWSNIVDTALTEAWGLAAKAALTGGKAALKGAKVAGKAAKLGKKTNMAANIGSALVNDLKGVANDAYDASAAGLVRNTFKDENGNWGFNPMRGIKKNIVGKVKTLDNVFAGGLGQMAYDHFTGNGEEAEGEEQSQDQQAHPQTQQVQPQSTQQTQTTQQKPVKKPVQKVAQQPIQKQA